MHFGEAGVGSQREIRDVFVILFAEEREEIAAVIVPGADGEMGVAAGDYFELREGEFAGEMFVGIDFDVYRVINREQAGLVKIVELLHWFEHLETQAAL